MKHRIVRVHPRAVTVFQFFLLLFRLGMTLSSLAAEYHHSQSTNEGAFDEGSSSSSSLGSNTASALHRGLVFSSSNSNQISNGVDRSSLLRGSDGPPPPQQRSNQNSNSYNNNQGNQSRRPSRPEIQDMFRVSRPDDRDAANRASMQKRASPPPELRNQNNGVADRNVCEFFEHIRIFWHLGMEIVEESDNNIEPSNRRQGASYVINSNLLTQSLNGELPNSFVSGVCDRIQVRDVDGEGDTILGGGYCRLTYTLTDNGGENSNVGYTFHATGEIFDGVGGVLAISGGTGPMLGAAGELRILPYNVNFVAETVTPNGEDAFESTDLFLAKATLYRNSCLKQTISSNTLS